MKLWLTLLLFWTSFSSLLSTYHLLCHNNLPINWQTLLQSHTLTTRIRCCGFYLVHKAQSSIHVTCVCLCIVFVQTLYESMCNLKSAYNYKTPIQLRVWVCFNLKIYLHWRYVLLLYKYVTSWTQGIFSTQDPWVHYTLSICSQYNNW